MNKTKLRIPISIILLMLSSIVSCDSDDSKDRKNEIQVKLIEQFCCGNIIILKNEVIESACETVKDSLLSAINANEFPIFQSLQVGETITIEYELTENCLAACGTICNRDTAIPIKILNAEN